MIVHKCDRCHAEVSGKLTFVNYIYYDAIGNANSSESIESFELCPECRVELVSFREGCSISESYRTHPRGTPRCTGVTG